jgi:N utilization substance protein B
MAGGVRRQARVIALQTLYEYDATHHDVAAVLQRHTENRRLDARVVDYADELVQGVVAHQVQLDSTIHEAAHEWPLDQMALIDKNILRVAIFEIELAKIFGSDASSRFINGVLGTIFSRFQGSPASNAGSEVH